VIVGRRESARVYNLFAEFVGPAISTIAADLRLSFGHSQTDPLATMRLKTALWVAAYLRRCQVEGLSAVVRRRGADEAGAIFVRICRLDGTSDLFGPAPQSALEQGAVDRAFTAAMASQQIPDAEIEAYLARQTKFDPDLWIVEVEDRLGRNFLNIVG
jgi:hypothetical protein